MDWINLAEDGDKWWVVVNMVVNPVLLQDVGNFICI
jgi:hypothetical protein